MFRFRPSYFDLFSCVICCATLLVAVNGSLYGAETANSRIDLAGLILDRASFDAHQPNFEADSSSTPLGMPKAPSAIDPMDAYWESAGSVAFPGVTGGNYQWPVGTEFEGKLIVGGGFTYAGSTSVNYIASWDGSGWSRMGDGFNSYVYALTVYDDRLIAGGTFSQSGTQPVNKLAAWDGTAWVSAFPYIDGTPDYFLTVGDLLYVVISDTTPYLTRVVVWNGTVWDTLGGDFNGYIYSLIQHDGKITVAGEFTMAGTTNAVRVAAWDGTAWHPFGAGIDGYVFALCSYNNKLVAGGYFEQAGSVPAHSLAEWDGTAWTAKDSGLGTTNLIRVLAVHEGDLYTGAKFANKQSVNRWNGSAWESVSQGHFRNGYPFFYGMMSWSGRLVALGSFAEPGNQVALWDGTTWSSAGEGFVEYASPLIEYDGRLIVGGTYGHTNATASGPVVAWNGSDWEDLESGINGRVQSMFCYGNKLIVSGVFDSAGGQPANNIAAWDGVTWTALGSGLDSLASAFAVYGNKLIVGGRFTTAGGEARPYLAAWDGQTWSSVGESPNGAITALSIYNGKLIVTGKLTAIGSLPVNWIASWNGQVWDAVGAGVAGPFVRVLQEYHGELIALGTDGLASAWNGQNWRNISGTGGYWHEANSAVVHAGMLIVGGFHSSFQNILKWDGSTWTTLGSGVSGRVWSFVSTDSMLYLSGGFAFAGSVLRPYVATWRVSSGCCSGTVGNIDESVAETPDLTDFSLLIAYLTSTPRPTLPCIQEANLDLSSAGAWPYVDLTDLSIMVSYLTSTPRPPLFSCP